MRKRPFSKFHSDIRHIADVSYGDIDSVWKDERGRYFGYFFGSGLRMVTERLARKALEYRTDLSKINRVKKMKRNHPRSGSKVIYNKVISIEAQKGKSSLWPREFFRHDFKKDKTAARVIGNPDGSLTIRSVNGKRLWKEFNY